MGDYERSIIRKCCISAQRDHSKWFTMKIISYKPKTLSHENSTSKVRYKLKNAKVTRKNN